MLFRSTFETSANEGFPFLMLEEKIETADEWIEALERISTLDSSWSGIP
jgi:hypothetical protein